MSPASPQPAEDPIRSLVSESLEDRVALDRMARDGLTMGDVAQMREAGLVDLERIIAHKLIPRNTWTSAAKARDGRLSSGISEKLLRFARIQAMAARTFGAARAAVWMERPTAALADQAPIDLLSTESGARAVETLLNRIAHGLAA